MAATVPAERRCINYLRGNGPLSAAEHVREAESREHLWHPERRDLLDLASIERQQADRFGRESVGSGVPEVMGEGELSVRMHGHHTPTRAGPERMAGDERRDGFPARVPLSLRRHREAGVMRQQ